MVWGADADLDRAHEIGTRYRSLRLGLVAAAVIAVAERLRAPTIATLEVRHFGAVAIRGRPRLIPRDLRAEPAGARGAPRQDTVVADEVL